MHLVKGTLRPLCTPVFLVYAQRYCTIYMALRPPELEQSSLPPSIPSFSVLSARDEGNVRLMIHITGMKKSHV